MAARQGVKMNSFEKWLKKSGYGDCEPKEISDLKDAYLAGLKKASRLAIFKESPVKAILDEIGKVNE